MNAFVLPHRPGHRQFITPIPGTRRSIRDERKRLGELLAQTPVRGDAA